MSSMSSAALAVVEDGVVSSSPQAGGPSRRRSWTACAKAEVLVENESACETGGGGTYLREQSTWLTLSGHFAEVHESQSRPRAPFGVMAAKVGGY